MGSKAGKTGNRPLRWRMLAILLAIVPAGVGVAGSLDIYVSPTGDGGKPGTEDAPTDLWSARGRARQALKHAKAYETVRIFLRGGTYALPQTFTLGPDDSGTAECPVEYLAFPGETPRLVGALPLTLRPLDKDDPNRERMDPMALDSIQVADLPGTLLWMRDSPGEFQEVFLDRKPMTLARYPKQVDPEQVCLFPANGGALRVGGQGLNPDVTGIYTLTDKKYLGERVYGMETKTGKWYIARHHYCQRWELSNRAAPGGEAEATPHRLASWSAFDSFSGPAGPFDEAQGAATGKPFIEAADGSTPGSLGCMLIQWVEPKGTGKDAERNKSSRIIKAPEGLGSRWILPDGSGARQEPVFLKGFPYHCWSDSRFRVVRIAKGCDLIELANTSHYGLRVGQPFFLENIPQELKARGEFFLDKYCSATQMRLYLIPHDEGEGKSGPRDREALLPYLRHVVAMDWVKWLKMTGLTFEASRRALVRVTGGENLTFSHCVFHNTTTEGMQLNGFGHTVDRCEFSNTGTSGLHVSGGDRISLTPSGTVISNCHFHHFGRRVASQSPGIRIEQFEMDDSKDRLEESTRDWVKEPVGISVLNNTIHHGPCQGILFLGNDHLIQGNHVHHVCQWTNDSGAIMTHGRDWGMRGTRIRENLIHHNGGPLGSFIAGVYLDSCLSGTTVERNLIVEPLDCLGRVGIILNGGRDVKLDQNLLVGPYMGFRLENTGVESITREPEAKVKNWDFLGKLALVPYRNPKWRERYGKALADIPDDWEAVKGSHWLQPEGCEITRNQYWGRKRARPEEWVSIAKRCYPGQAPKDATNPLQVKAEHGNAAHFEDPGIFMDAARGDYALRPDSPALGLRGSGFIIEVPR